MDKADFIRGCVAFCMIGGSFLVTLVLGVICSDRYEEPYLASWFWSCLSLGVVLTVLLLKCGVI